MQGKSKNNWLANCRRTVGPSTGEPTHRFTNRELTDTYLHSPEKEIHAKPVELLFYCCILYILQEYWDKNATMSRKNITSQQIQNRSTANYLSDIVRIFFNAIKITEHSLTLSSSQCESMPMKGSEAILSSGTDDCAVKGASKFGRCGKTLSCGYWSESYLAVLSTCLLHCTKWFYQIDDIFLSLFELKRRRGGRREVSCINGNWKEGVDKRH